MTDSMKSKLITHLTDINKYKNLWKAKKNFDNNPLFNKYLNQIKAIGINPVIIPRDRRVPFLTNPMEALVRAIDPTE